MQNISLFSIFLILIITIFLGADTNVDGRSSTCNNYNNDCTSCIQSYNEDRRVKVHNCNFCFVDGK